MVFLIYYLVFFSKKNINNMSIFIFLLKKTLFPAAEERLLD